MSVVLADQTPKTALDWVSQAAWLLGALVGGPMLFTRGYPVHGLLLLVVAGASIAWVEYVARARDKRRAALIAAGVVGALVLTNDRDDKD